MTRPTDRSPEERELDRLRRENVSLRRAVRELIDEDALYGVQEDEERVNDNEEGRTS